MKTWKGRNERLRRAVLDGEAAFQNDRLLAHEDFGVFTRKTGEREHFKAPVASGHRGGHGLVIALSEFRRTARPERHTAHAAGLPKIDTGDRHLIAGPAFIRSDIVDLWGRSRAALRLPDLIGARSAYAFDAAPWRGD